MTVIQNLGIVRHGRRAGSARKSPELEVSGRNLVMPQEELERIRKNLTKEADEAAIHEAKMKAKAELHAKSREQVSKWTNTLAGQRMAKLKAAEPTNTAASMSLMCVALLSYSLKTGCSNWFPLTLGSVS